MKKAILILFTLLTFMSMDGQERRTPDSISTKTLLSWAYCYKYGINTDVSLEKSVQILKYLAHKKQPDGMRELGCMYLHGQGVEQNSRYALRLFKCASDSGDVKAMCYLAQMYQQALGVKQNYSKAFDLYSKAAKKGSGRGCYGAGYMLYKGLGIKQDYGQAIKYLENGSDLGYSSCDFLLGSYYMHGYNGAPDYDKAKNYFDRAVKRGHGWTIDLIKYSMMDSLKSEYAQRASIPMLMAGDKIPTTCADVDSMLTILPTDTLAGSWSGTVYTCDWSGRQILKEEPIKIDIKPQDTLIDVIWTWGNNDGVFSSTLQCGKYWHITSLGDNESDSKWVIKSIAFGMADENTLYARLNCMNIKHYEKRKPVFAVLHRDKQVQSECHMPLRILKVEPMPINSDNFTVHLQADTNCNANVSIHSISGLKIADCGTVHINKGKNSLLFNTSLHSGQYVLTFSSKVGNASVSIITQ